MSSVRLLVNGHHYDLQISGGGEALLLLHGFSGDKTNWEELRAGLQDTVPGHRGRHLGSRGE